MKNFQIFDSYELEKIKAIEKNIKSSYVGFIYILEYGKNIKIGHSKKPSTRIKSLKNQARYNDCKLEKIAISKPHTNYINNERLLHEYFKQYRISETELFSMTLQQALSEFPNDLQFLGESEIRTQRANQGLEFIKNFLNVSETPISDNDLLINILENQKMIQNQINNIYDLLNNITDGQKNMQKYIHNILDFCNHVIIPFIEIIIQKLK